MSTIHGPDPSCTKSTRPIVILLSKSIDLIILWEGATGMRISVGSVVLAAIAGWSVSQGALPVCAQVKPGDTITISNAAEVKEFVSPGVYYKVTHGMALKIVPTSQLDWPPPYTEATEKYSSQVILSRDHRELVGYVAGLPFPFVDANDPEAATKIIWNVTFHPTLSDDYDLRFYECRIENTSLNGAPDPYAYTAFGHYAGYSLIGRTEVEPIPVDPDLKISGRVWLSAIYPQIAPRCCAAQESSATATPLKIAVTIPGLTITTIAGCGD